MTAKPFRGALKVHSQYRGDAEIAFKKQPNAKGRPGTLGARAGHIGSVPVRAIPQRSLLIFVDNHHCGMEYIRNKCCKIYGEAHPGEE